MITLSEWSEALTMDSSAPGKNELECVSCMESFPQKKCVVGPCKHAYCRKCVASLVETCLRDERLFPVRCCKQIVPLSLFIGILNTNLRSRFEHKALEFSTSADWRVYCSNANCSVFLGSSIGEVRSMTCARCRTSTCSGCRQPPHSGETCRGNADAMKVRQMAKKERWQTCPGCNAIVEQNSGCNHMTCRCRTEFCYLCGIKWKRCPCPRFGDQAQGIGNNPEPLRHVDEEDLQVPDEGDRAGDEDEEPYFNPYMQAQLYLDNWDRDEPVVADGFFSLPRFTDNYDSSDDDESPYTNPYDMLEEFGWGVHPPPQAPDIDLSQSLLNMFLPSQAEASDNEGPYINPYDPAPTSSSAYHSDDEAPRTYPRRFYDTSDDEDVYVNPYDSELQDRSAVVSSVDSSPDSLTRYHDASDDEGPYANPYGSALQVHNASVDSPPESPHYDVSDDEDPYINPYDD